MLKRVFQRRGELRRSFGSKAIQKSTSFLTQANAKGEAIGAPELQVKGKLPSIQGMKFTGNTLNLFEWLQQGGKVEDVAEMEYMKYPYHISHNDPHSPDYIQSEFMDNQKKAEVDDYNRIIDNLKLDLKLLEEYQTGYKKALDHHNHSAEKEVGNTANVFDKVRDYGAVGGNPGNADIDDMIVDLSLLDNLKITINNTPFHRKFTKTSNVVAWEKERDERPVNAHFHLAKGHKYDVETPWEERAPHVADRLGHPEIFPTPLETLLRLERFDCHPGYLDQPFIQIPSAEPDKDLNFRPGEVVYENPVVEEYYKFSVWGLTFGSAFFAVWYPYMAFVKSSTPYPSVRDEFRLPFYDLNFNNFDTYMVWPAFYLFIGCFWHYTQYVD